MARILLGRKSSPLWLGIYLLAGLLAGLGLPAGPVAAAAGPVPTGVVELYPGADASAGSLATETALPDRQTTRKRALLKSRFRSLRELLSRNAPGPPLFLQPGATPGLYPPRQNSHPAGLRPRQALRQLRTDVLLN